jgi:hypothetical protein
VSDILADISYLAEDEQVEALRRAPRAVRALLYFTYGPFELDLPLGPLSYAVIPTDAFVGATELGDEDLLARDTHSLTRIYAAGVHPTITSARRLEVWKSLQARLPARERVLLDRIRMYREVPGISREVVALAFPGMLDTPPAPEPPVQGIEYPPSAFTGDPAPIHEAPTPEAPRELTPNEARYESMMRRMGFDRL